MKITADMLREHNACQGQVKRFEAEWPDGVRVTLKACKRAVELGLDLDWAAENLLSADAGTVYDAATVDTWEVYNAAIADAGTVYDAATVDAGTVYDAATVDAWEVYDAATVDAWEVEDAAIADAFYRAAKIA